MPYRLRANSWWYDQSAQARHYPSFLKAWTMAILFSLGNPGTRFRAEKLEKKS